MPEMPPVGPGTPASRIRSDMLSRGRVAGSGGEEATIPETESMGPVAERPANAPLAPSRRDRFYGEGGDTVSVRAHTQFYRGESAVEPERAARHNRFYGEGGPTVSVRAGTNFYRGAESAPAAPESKDVTPLVARATGEAALHGAEAPPSRIRGKSLDRSTMSFVRGGESESRPRGARSEGAKRGEADRSEAAGHAPTWKLEFGKHGTGYGHFDSDGFEAMNSNSVSGEDAFAVNKEGTRFAVTDGLGGSAASNKENGGTAFFAKFIADAAVTQGADVITDPRRLADLYVQAEDAFEALTGERFKTPRYVGRSIRKVATTLSYAEVLGTTPEGKTRVRFLVIGDSPAYIRRGDGTIREQLGEDAQTGESDMPLAFVLGIDGTGKLVIPDEVAKERASGRHRSDPRHVVDKTIDLGPDEEFVLASDYFSDHTANGGSLDEFDNLSAAEYHAKVRRMIEAKASKADDATRARVKPSKVARRAGLRLAA